MLKYSALLFNTIALLICQLFFVEEVKITQNMPSSAKADSEFVVEITINKGSMGGFAKLQQALPPGLSATPLEMKGGDFKFVDQQVKIIWMSLPSDKEFKISYKISVAKGVGGDQKIGGKFSYVIDNVKQEVTVPESTVSIPPVEAETPVAAAEPTPVPNTPVTETKTEIANQVLTETPAAETKSTEVAKTETPAAEPTPVETKTESTSATADNRTTTTPAAQNADGVSCSRKAPNQVAYSKTNASNDFVVEIKINKGNVSGFAKLLETLPAGFTATAMESAGATFTFAEQKVKFVWVSVPSQTEFQVSYKVSVPEGVSGNMNIDGVFSYIENDETKKASLATSTIIIDNSGAGTPIAATTETPATTNTQQEQPKETTTEVVKSTTTENTATSGTTEAAISTTPAPQGNVTYRVQIAALRSAKPANAVASIYNISESVTTEMAEGYTKYTVGSHSEYKSARDARENVKSKGVVGPFVTAYNTGKRITVQEALMITSQKWYK